MHFIVSYDIQNTATGQGLGTAEVVVPIIEEVGPLVEHLFLTEGHDDFVLTVRTAE